MAANWDISADTHGRMVTCQKPILVVMETDNVQVSHFKIDLQIRDLSETTFDGGYFSLGLNVCAYPDGPPDSDGNTTYTVNFADYCRHYFELSRQVIHGNYCPNGDTVNPLLLPNLSLESTVEFYHMFRREFRAKIHPVLVDGNGIYFEEPDNYKFCSEFMCVNLNIKNNEHLSGLPDTYHEVRIDDFVNGFVVSNNNNNNAYGGPNLGTDVRAKLFTNMPGVAAPGQEPEGPFNTINLKDHRSHWVGYGWNFSDFSSGGHVRRHYWQIRDIATGNLTTYNIASSAIPGWSQTQPTEIGWLYIAPIQLQFTFDVNGIGANAILDNNSNLMCDRIKAWVEFEDSSGDVKRRGASFTYNVVNEVDNGKCRRTRFVFINSRGHLDWFHCHGTHEKSVKVEGSTYERLSQISRTASIHRFKTSPSFHGLNNLQNTRVDSYKVTTQPLTKKWAEWLQELATSPMVWVDEFLEGTEIDIMPGGGVETHLVTRDNAETLGPFVWPNRLTPVIIDKSSYNVYNTEDNVHYMEFKYVKSKDLTVQKGY